MVMEKMKWSCPEIYNAVSRIIKNHFKWSFRVAHQCHETSEGLLFGYKRESLVLETDHNLDGDPEFELLICYLI